MTREGSGLPPATTGEERNACTRFCIPKMRGLALRKEASRLLDPHIALFFMILYQSWSVTLAVTFMGRSYGNMYIMKAGFAFTDSSQ